MFKLALIQMSVAGGNKSANLLHAKEFITEAAKNGAHIALLPEAMNLGWLHPSAITNADPIPYGESCSLLIDTAVKNNIYVCAGLVEKKDSDIYNSAVLISSDGEIILTHRKINLLDVEEDFYKQGERLSVCQTKFGTIGLMICSDAFAEEKVLSQSLCYMGADVILSPGSWAVPPGYDMDKKPPGKIWINHYRSVAKKYSVYIAGVSNVGLVEKGPWRGFNAIGNSLVLDHNGSVIAEGPCSDTAETIIYSDISPVKRPARGCGWISYWKDIPSKNLIHK